MSDNLTGMRRAIHDMEVLARSHPTFVPFVPYARAEHARICGDYGEALERIEDALRMITAGEHPLWPWAAGSRIAILLALGRIEEAHRLGLRDLEIAGAVGLQVMKDHLELPLALVEAARGSFTSACERLDAMNERRRHMQMQGVTLGWGYEARARVALAMGDAQSFKHNAHLCAQQYRKAEGDPSLAAKYERLIQDARNRALLEGAEIVDTLESSGADLDTTTPTVIGPSAAAALYAISTCASAGERASSALRLLLDSTGAVDGQLYLIERAGLKLAAASRDDLECEDARTKWTELIEAACANRRSSDDDMPTRALRAPATEAGYHCDSALLLTCVRNGKTALAGVAALRFASAESTNAPPAIGAAIADLLINAGDVEARTIPDE
jgi:hypothetical protein